MKSDHIPNRRMGFYVYGEQSILVVVTFGTDYGASNIGVGMVRNTGDTSKESSYSLGSWQLDVRKREDFSVLNGFRQPSVEMTH